MAQPMTQLMNPVPPMPLTVHQLADAVVVEVRGEVDLHTAPQLRETLVALLEYGPPVVMIDLHEVTFFGASGLAALIEAQYRSGDLIRLRVVAAEPAIRRLRRIGMHRRVALYLTRDEALAGHREL